MVISRIPRVGIGGPVGSGKSLLIERMVPILYDRGYVTGIISNDVISKEDADRIRHTLSTNLNIIPKDLVVGLATGGCPHTAVREDPSMNLAVIEEMEQSHPELDIIIIESGGDNITTTFSPVLADYFIYVIDVAGGDKYPRKGGLGIQSCDLLVINKIDLAPHVDANLETMSKDSLRIRDQRPFLMSDCRHNTGVDSIVDHIISDILFDQAPKAHTQ